MLRVELWGNDFKLSYIPVTVITAEDPAAPTDLRMSIFLPLLKDERVDANLYCKRSAVTHE